MALVPRPEVNVYGCEPKLNKNKLNRHLKIEEKAAEKDAKKKELHEEQLSQANAPASTTPLTKMWVPRRRAWTQPIVQDLQPSSLPTKGHWGRPIPIPTQVPCRCLAHSLHPRTKSTAA